MKKMVLALIAAMTMTTAMTAQENNNQNRERRHFDRTEMMKKRTEQMVKTYGLNEEQAKQLEELNTKFAEKMAPGRGFRQGGNRGQRPEIKEKKDMVRPDSLKGNMRPHRDMNANFEKMRQSREEYDTELQKIMTEEQFKAYKADEAKRMSRGPRGGRDHNRGPRQEGDMQ